MDTLQWENGTAPLLRGKILTHLRAIYSKTVGGRIVVDGAAASMKSAKLLIALRFRRTVMPSAASFPRQYTHEVDVAWMTPEPKLVTDMLRSRAPYEPVRYDILAARLTMPAGLRAALEAPPDIASSTPLLLELLDANGEKLYQQRPDAAADNIGITDVVRSLRPLDYVATPRGVLDALSSGVNRWATSNTWRSRPPRLLAIAEVYAAALMAMDSPHSPCAAIAQNYRIFAALPFGGDLEMATYEGSDESAKFPGGSGGGDPVKGFVRLKTEPANIARVTPKVDARFLFESPTSPDAPYMVESVAAVGPMWTHQLEIPMRQQAQLLFRDNEYTGEAASATTGRRTSDAIVAKAATILAQLVQLKMPKVGSDQAQLEVLYLMRSYLELRDYLPAQVLDEFMTRVVGVWAYKLMSNGITHEASDGSTQNRNFWRDVVFSAVVLPGDAVKKTQGSYLHHISQTLASDAPRPVELSPSFFGHNEASYHPEYTKLVKAIVLHMLPWFGRMNRFG